MNKRVKATYTLNIFVAYHPSDKEKFQELLGYLERLNETNKGYVINKIWHDGRDLDADSRALIDELTEAADLVLLLLSDTAILSPYFSSQAIKNTYEQHLNERSIVVPIILNTCWWEETIFKDLDVLPRAGLPIYDSNDVKTALFEQVVEELDKRLDKVRKRKFDQERQFKLKIEEADAFFKNWQQHPKRLRQALFLYEEALGYWRDGFSPDQTVITSKIEICHREIDFSHYARAAREAFDLEDYSSAYFNCKDALKLRNDSSIQHLFEAVEDALQKIDTEQKFRPFSKSLKAAQAHFLNLEWDAAHQAFNKALLLHFEHFEPSRATIEHKIEICRREAVLERMEKDASHLFKHQNYQKMINLLLAGIKEVHYATFDKIDHCMGLIDNLASVYPFLDEKSNRWGYANKENNQVIIAAKYVAAFNFSENLAGVRKWDKWGFIDIEGNEIIPFMFEYVSHFQNGIAQVIYEGITRYINHEGKWVAGEEVEVENK